jgi:hypothetical protein
MQGVYKAALAMRKTKRAIKKEWNNFHTRFEEEEAASIQNFI